MALSVFNSLEDPPMIWEDDEKCKNCGHSDQMHFFAQHETVEEMSLDGMCLEKGCNCDDYK